MTSQDGKRLASIKDIEEFQNEADDMYHRTLELIADCRNSIDESNKALQNSHALGIRDSKMNMYS